MKILITNDDGYKHLGHLSLKKMLQDLKHDVWSIAPQENQSGVSMKLSLGKSLEFRETGEQCWSCSGTPVDCVLFALHGVLPFRPDAIIAGINAGANLSDDLWYSGTAAAAREACKWGLPSLALSYSSPPPYREDDFVSFYHLLQNHLGDLLEACSLEDETATESSASPDFLGFLNINIPPHCNGQIRFASRFEPRPYQNVLHKLEDNHYILGGNINAQHHASPNVDSTMNALSQVSISLGAFHALQPLPSPLAAETGSGPLRLRSTARASQAMRRIANSGIPA